MPLYLPTTGSGGGGVPKPQVIPAIFCHQEDPTNLLKYAKARSFNAITAAEYIAAVTTGAALPDKPFFLSFDDEVSQWTTIHDPALATYGQKATGFISTGYPDGEVMGGGTDPFFYTNTTPLTWDQLRTLKATGRWDFQNHTRNHGPFNTMTTLQRQTDWTYSQARLLAELGVVPQAFCHPQNAYTLQSIVDAYAFGFKLITISEASVSGLSISHGLQGRYGRVFAGGENRRPGPIIVGRSSLAGDGVGQLSTVMEQIGNRIPDVPMEDNTLGIWVVNAGEGSEGSSSNGVRFDQPDKSGSIDLRGNASTTNVSTTTAHFIAVEPDERLTFTYLRECGVGVGSYIVRIKEYGKDRVFLRNTDIETLTGTIAVAANDVVYQVPADVYAVKVEARLLNPPAGSYATLQTPFLGRVR